MKLLLFNILTPPDIFYSKIKPGGFSMIIKDVNWLRASTGKLCPKLRKHALEWYRPTLFTPCFIHKIDRNLKLRWRKIPVIVQLENNPDLVASLSSQELTSLMGCRIKKKLPLIQSFSTEVNEDLLKKLINNKNVRKIYYDSETKAVLDLASPTVKAPVTWERGLTGKGIAIAVLDTGIEEHPDLSDRIRAFMDFVRNRKEAYDDNGHGTHVAGCTAANGSRYKGTAPEAELVGVKVLDKRGSGSLSTVIEGVQWCIEQQDSLKIRIINLSLGSDAYQSHRDDPLCQAVQKAWASGMVVCAAAGNSGPEKGTINSPGIEPMIITVGASNDRHTPDPGKNSVADFSSRGPTIDELAKPDLVAPGVEIVSLRASRSFLDKTSKEARVGKRYLSLSGTSMATPVCAGVAAQLLQADSSLSPEKLKTVLMNNATKIPGAHRYSQGAGIIDAEKAAAVLTIKVPEKSYAEENLTPISR